MRLIKVSIYGRGRAILKRQMGWELHRRGEEVYVEFVGRLKAEEGSISAAAVVQEFESGARVLVCDVRTMSGYDRVARDEWQKHLTPIRENIDRFVLVGGNALIQMGASVLAMFLRLDLSCVDLPEGERAHESSIAS